MEKLGHYDMKDERLLGNFFDEDMDKQETAEKLLNLFWIDKIHHPRDSSIILQTCLTSDGWFHVFSIFLNLIINLTS